MQGSFCGILMGASAVVNPAGALWGGVSQLVSDAIKGEASSMEAYTGAMVGGTMSNPFMSGVVSVAVGETLENLDGINEKNVGEIVVDSLINGAFSAAGNMLVGKGVTYNAEYYLRIRLSQESIDVIQALFGGYVDATYNLVRKDCLE